MPYVRNNYSSRYYPQFRSRSIRRSESKAKTRLFLTLIVSGLILALFIFWGLPTLVSGLSFLNKNKSVPQSPVSDPAIAPPVLNIPYEATNSASIRVHGYSSPNSQVEIYLDGDLKTTTQADDNGKFTTDEVSLSIGQNNISGKTVNLSGKKSLPSKTIILIYSNQKPKLEISSPSDNQQIKGGDKKIIVAGSTNPLNSVTINGTAAIVRNDGTFSVTIPINDGDNTIAIGATDQFGNTNQIERRVTYSSS